MTNRNEYRVLTNTNNLTRADWLKFRKKGIGGSDAGAVLGVNKYKTPLDVYLDKISDNVDDTTISEPAYWGTVLEEVVAKEFAKQTGKKIRKKNAILQNKKCPFMLANVDRLIDGENALLECKTASEYLKDEWTDDNVPQSYIIQCQHYMAVTGCEKVYIAVLIGGNKFQYKTIERDNDIILYLIGKECKFWRKNVEKRNPPYAPEASNNTLLKLFPKANGKEIQLSEDYNNNISVLLKLKEQKKALEKDIADIESDLKLRIGENSGASTSEYVITWKQSKYTRFDTKKFRNKLPSLYEKFLIEKPIRRFSVKEKKEID